MNPRKTNKSPGPDRRRRLAIIAWSITAAAAAIAGVGPATTGPTSVPGTTTAARTAATIRAAATTGVTTGVTTRSATRPTTAATTTTGPAVSPLPPTTGQSGSAGNQPPAVVPIPPQPEIIDGEVKYWMAYLKGQQLRETLQQENASADDYNVVHGFLDGLTGHPPAYTKDDIEDRIARMQSMAAAKRAEKQYADDPNFRHRADENLQKSRAAIEQFSQLEGTETRIDGVLVRVLDPGTGRVVGNAKTLTMRVRVELSDGSLVKGTDPNQTVTVPTADLLPDLVENLRGMKVGGHWRVLLPPERAYGQAGKPPLVGPNEALLYDIVLTGAQ